MEDSGPKLDRTLARAEVEGEVRAEFAEAAHKMLDTERDKRVAALVVSGVVAGAVLLPVIALVAGFSWRLLMWAAGG